MPAASPGGPARTASEQSLRGLRYIDDTRLPGITRHRRGTGFHYRMPDGKPVRDETELQRIRRLAIPPAYTEVWICPFPEGHLQATGRDARGRKQYRYHADWIAQRDADKFARLEAFGRALPRIRRRVARDLAAPPKPLGANLILATLVRLLDTTYLRVGNEEYARLNRSYGLTTLRNHHAGVHAGEVRLSFRGKHGVWQEVSLHDKLVARAIRRCKQLPGQDLFQYEADGQLHRIGSGDVNGYLSDAAGEHFTAKDFRTWHGTVEALQLVRAACRGGEASWRGFSMPQAVAEVARRLGNTVAVCRKSYIHPAVLALGLRLAEDSTAGVEIAALLEPPQRAPAGLRAEERRLLALLARTRRAPRAGARQNRKKQAALS